MRGEKCQGALARQPGSRRIKGATMLAIKLRAGLVYTHSPNMRIDRFTVSQASLKPTSTAQKVARAILW